MSETLKRAAEMLRKQAKLVLSDNIDAPVLYVFSNAEREAADMVIIADELERMAQVEPVTILVSNPYTCDGDPLRVK